MPSPPVPTPAPASEEEPESRATTISRIAFQAASAACCSASFLLRPSPAP